MMKTWALQSHPVVALRDLLLRATARLTRRGLAWSVAPPFVWALLFHGLGIHVRMSLGRWPRFGESLPTLPLAIHERAVWLLLAALLLSLWPAAALFIGSLFVRGRRHFAIYFLCYAAAVGAAILSMYVAPGPFLNWFFD